MSKKTGGFTLIEVLLALLILAMTGYVLAGQQVGSLVKLAKSRQLVERIYLLKKQLYLFLISPPKNTQSITVELQIPEVTIVSSCNPISKKSAFAKISPDLYYIKSRGSWKSFMVSRDESMMSFVYAHQLREAKE